MYVKDRTNESFFRVIDAHSTKDTDVIKDMFPPAYVEGLNTITRIAMSNSRFGDITAILWGGTPNYLYYKNEALRQGKTEEQQLKLLSKNLREIQKRHSSQRIFRTRITSKVWVDSQDLSTCSKLLRSSI